MNQYDYIICGAGCAGLTFLYEVLLQENLNSKKILVIDFDSKTKNDRTWCFWENSDIRFSKIINHKWHILDFKSVEYNNSFNILPYKYNIISGINFYTFVINYAQKFGNIEFVESEIIDIKTNEDAAWVVTKKGDYTGTYIFNSIVFNKNKLNTKNSLLQHFKGIEIETSTNCFDATKATFMDFSISQQKGTSFMYVLPTAPNKALIEYTLFTKNILNEKEYDEALEQYIKNNLGIENYKITHTELGIIPMTDYKFPLYNGNIINIGTAAGCVKPSSGFAFKFIQKHTQQIVSLLAQNKKPHLQRTFADKKFHFYDAVLLEILAQNKMQGSEIFASIFKKNPPQLVLKFLDNETNWWEDLKIMNSVPMKIFLPVAIKKLCQKY